MEELEYRLAKLKGSRPPAIRVHSIRVSKGKFVYVLSIPSLERIVNYCLKIDLKKLPYTRLKGK